MLLQLNESNIDNNKYKIVDFLQLYNKNDSNIDYSEYYMIISYTDTECIGYDYFIIKDKEEINKRNLFLSNFKGKKILLIHDIHDYTFRNQTYDSFKSFCKQVKIDLVIGNYIFNNESKIIEDILLELNIKYCVMPNLIDSDMFKDYNHEKIYDILIYGCMAECYSFRRRLLNIIKSNKSNWKTRIIYIEDKICGEKLSREINKSYLCVACDSIYNYFLMKYIEIPLSNSFLIGSMPMQGNSLFDANSYIHIDSNMSDEEIINIINISLTDKQRIIENITNFTPKLEFYKRKYYNNYLTLGIDFLNNKIYNTI